MLRKVKNPAHRFSGKELSWIGEAPKAQQEVFEERAKSILSENRSPDLGFRWSINPYRGCHHACTYCYARPTHQYLEFGAGTDFQNKLIAKINAAELLEKAFNKKSWQGEAIVFSGNTDCYQPLELRYELTKQCLEVCTRYRNPVSIITKGAIIQRDIEQLAELNQVSAVQVTLSITSVDKKISRIIEPSAPSPEIRFGTMRKLSDAGIPVALSLSPLIPGLNDTMIPEIVSRAADSGASSAFSTLIRLPAEVEQIFCDSLKEALPERTNKILSAIQEMKEGKLNRSTFGKRFQGSGTRWDALRWLFESSCEKHGLAYSEESQVSTLLRRSNGSFRRPQAQLSLFANS